MSEQIPETPVETDAPATDAVPETKPAELGDAGKRAIDAMKAERDAARREARSNSEAAKRLAEMEESQKSEAQKIADRAAAAERERDDARTETLRYKAAATHGVDADHFDLLGSGDEDTITARAERVGGFLKQAAELEQVKAELEALKAGRPAPTFGRPTTALKPGATPEEVKGEDAEYQQYAGRFNRRRQ